MLNVDGEGALFDAIGRCVASLCGDAASAYRADASGVVDAAMAVVVQRMVQAPVAGVAFGIDPATGEERVVVEAIAGLGEALVSGAAEAARMVLDADGEEVIDQHHPGEPILTVELAREVAAQTLRADEVFGTPQDIEFAFAGGQLWLLQSRPVTTTAVIEDQTRPGEFDTATDAAQEWTSANVQEILPGLLTPFTIALNQWAGHLGYTVLYHDNKLLDQDEWPDSFGYFYNRAFLNMTTLRLIVNRMLGGEPDALEHRARVRPTRPLKPSRMERCLHGVS